MNSLSYYQILANYLLSLQSQTSKLSMSNEEELYIKEAISSIYQLTQLQIQELQNEH